MAGYPMKVNFERVHGERRAVPDDVCAARVPANGGVEVVKNPFAGHVGFAHKRFFGRAAVKTNGARDIFSFHRSFQPHHRPHAGGAKQVMATAVPWPPFHKRRVAAV